MAHHGGGIDSGLSDALRKLGVKLGATGDYPQGKLTDADEGGINIAIGNNDGKVVIDFGKPVAWIGFDPDQAESIAQALVKQARNARGGS